MKSTNFEGIITLLATAQVDFIIIGGFAATLHGTSYVTFDLDICYERSPDNARRLAKALASYHPTLRGAPKDLPFTLDAETILAGLNFTLDTDLGDVDLLGDVSPIGEYPQVLSRSIPMELFGHQVNVISVDALISIKKVIGRTKDLLLIPQLEALREMQEGEADED